MLLGKTAMLLLFSSNLLHSLPLDYLTQKTICHPPPPFHISLPQQYIYCQRWVIFIYKPYPKQSWKHLSQYSTSESSWSPSIRRFGCRNSGWSLSFRPKALDQWAGSVSLWLGDCRAWQWRANKKKQIRVEGSKWLMITQPKKKKKNLCVFISCLSQ